MRNFFHSHNLTDPSKADSMRLYGIRASLPASDPFTRLVGKDWAGEEWFASATERDQALEKKRERHGYYRQGDDVSVVYEAIDKND